MWFACHECFDCLAQDLVFYPDHCTFGYSLHLADDVLYFFGTDAFTPGFDHVIFSSQEVEKTFLVAAEVIACKKQFLPEAWDFPECLFGLPGGIPISPHHIGATNHQLSCFSISHRV